MKRMWKIKNLLTFAFSIIGAIIASVFLIFIAKEQVTLQETSLNDNVQQLSDTITYNISSELYSMNQASLSILYSNSIRDSFSTYVDVLNKEIKQEYGTTLYDNSKLLSDMVHTIITGEGTFSKIVLYDPEYGSYTFGPNTFYSENNILEKAWHSDLKVNDGMLITKPYLDQAFSAETTYNLDRMYISLIRPYLSDYNTIEGYVEVVQNYDVIFNVLDAISYNDAYQIYITSTDGSYLYPSSSLLDQDTHQIMENLTSPLIEGSNEYQTHEGVDYIIHQKTFDDYGYQTQIVIAKNSLYEPIYNYIVRFFLLSLVIIISVVLVTLLLSNFITKPIYALYQIIKTTDITEKEAFHNTTLTTNLLELNALWIALVNSHDKMRDSMNLLIESEKRELQSKMIALQSQMNPHFLYNSLSVLSTLIDDKKVDEAEKFCDNLSSMLRYVTSTEEPLVSLEEELEHTGSYLECMGYRYEGDLTYSFDVPDDLLMIQVPKLSVQSLVENATKYMTVKKAPWHTNIKVYRDERMWYIEVSDNGVGFHDDVLETLMKKLDLLKEGILLPHQSLNGMGLINLLYRIKIRCNCNPYLDIQNRSEGGCVVTIGGNIINEQTT